MTILIGVNNQYRNLNIDSYTREFNEVVQFAIKKVKSTQHVIALSIPDWGATPFGLKSGRENISNEIDTYNEINREISRRNLIQYLEITSGTRMAISNPAIVAEDGLHPSALEYKRWATLLLPLIKTASSE